jgi:NTP pyrophosphatase (non-canonical NTP hydrolase)
MQKLIELVEEWSIDKGLHEGESSKQYLKVSEEVGEVAAALARGDQDALRDGIGDVIVTLIILAQQNDMDLHECLLTAYDEIKDRKGEMKDGVFIKAGETKRTAAETLTGIPKDVQDAIRSQQEMLSNVTKGRIH